MSNKMKMNETKVVSCNSNIPSVTRIHEMVKIQYESYGLQGVDTFAAIH